MQKRTFVILATLFTALPAAPAFPAGSLTGSFGGNSFQEALRYWSNPANTRVSTCNRPTASVEQWLVDSVSSSGLINWNMKIPGTSSKFPQLPFQR